MKEDLWKLFCRTGLPEAYLLYKELRDGDQNDGSGAPRDGDRGE